MRGRAAQPRHAHGRGGDVDAEREATAVRQGQDVAPRAAADVEHGPARAVEDRLVGRGQRSEPAVQRERHRGARPAGGRAGAGARRGSSARP